MALKYRIQMDELSCSCPASFFDHSKSCKHVQALLQAGVHRHSDYKFRVFKEGKNWLGGNCDLGFVGDTVSDVMNAIADVTRVQNVA